MLCGPVVGLTAAAGAALLAGTAPQAVETGVFVWHRDEATFGGLSAIDLTPDGHGFVAVTDWAAVYAGTLRRGAGGQVIGVDLAPDMPVMLLSHHGVPVGLGMRDTEGVALAEDGSLYISFEGEDHVGHYGPEGRKWLGEDWPDEFSAFDINAGIEALAIDAAGRLWAMPEKSPDPAAIPVYRKEDGRWTRPLTLRRDGTWRPVGADFGPDGRLYLLERDYWPILGFMSRVRRITLEGDTVVQDRVVMQSPAGVYDNLEGLSVWRDAEGGIRLTLISDDNFLPVQKTEIVDFRMTE